MYSTEKDIFTVPLKEVNCVTLLKFTVAKMSIPLTEISYYIVCPSLLYRGALIVASNECARLWSIVPSTLYRSYRVTSLGAVMFEGKHSTASVVFQKKCSIVFWLTYVATPALCTC